MKRPVSDSVNEKPAIEPENIDKNRIDPTPTGNPLPQNRPKSSRKKERSSSSRRRSTPDSPVIGIYSPENPPLDSAENQNLDLIIQKTPIGVAGPIAEISNKTEKEAKRLTRKPETLVEKENAEKIVIVAVPDVLPTSTEASLLVGDEYSVAVPTDLPLPVEVPKVRSGRKHSKTTRKSTTDEKADPSVSRAKTPKRRRTEAEKQSVEDGENAMDQPRPEVARYELNETEGIDVKTNSSSSKPRRKREPTELKAAKLTEEILAEVSDKAESVHMRSREPTSVRAEALLDEIVNGEAENSEKKAEFKKAYDSLRKRMPKDSQPATTEIAPRNARNAIKRPEVQEKSPQTNSTDRGTVKYRGIVSVPTELLTVDNIKETDESALQSVDSQLVSPLTIISLARPQALPPIAALLATPAKQLNNAEEIATNKKNMTEDHSRYLQNPSVLTGKTTAHAELLVNELETIGLKDHGSAQTVRTLVSTVQPASLRTSNREEKPVSDLSQQSVSMNGPTVPLVEKVADAVPEEKQPSRVHELIQRFDSTTKIPPSHAADEQLRRVTNMEANNLVLEWLQNTASSPSVENFDGTNTKLLHEQEHSERRSIKPTIHGASAGSPTIDGQSGATDNIAQVHFTTAIPRIREATATEATMLVEKLLVESTEINDMQKITKKSGVVRTSTADENSPTVWQAAAGPNKIQTLNDNMENPSKGDTLAPAIASEQIPARISDVAPPVSSPARGTTSRDKRTPFTEQKMLPKEPTTATSDPPVQTREGQDKSNDSKTKQIIENLLPKTKAVETPEKKKPSPKKDRSSRRSSSKQKPPETPGLTEPNTPATEAAATSANAPTPQKIPSDDRNRPVPDLEPDVKSRHPTVDQAALILEEIAKDPKLLGLVRVTVLGGTSKELAKDEMKNAETEVTNPDKRKKSSKRKAPLDPTEDIPKEPAAKASGLVLKPPVDSPNLTTIKPTEVRKASASGRRKNSRSREVRTLGEVNTTPTDEQGGMVVEQNIRDVVQTSVLEAGTKAINDVPKSTTTASRRDSPQTKADAPLTLWVTGGILETPPVEKVNLDEVSEAPASSAKAESGVKADNPDRKKTRKSTKNRESILTEKEKDKRVAAQDITDPVNNDEKLVKTQEKSIAEIPDPGDLPKDSPGDLPEDSRSKEPTKSRRKSTPSKKRKSPRRDSNLAETGEIVAPNEPVAEKLFVEQQLEKITYPPIKDEKKPQPRDKSARKSTAAPSPDSQQIKAASAPLQKLDEATKPPLTEQPPVEPEKLTQADRASIRLVDRKKKPTFPEPTAEELPLLAIQGLNKPVTDTKAVDAAKSPPTGARKEKHVDGLEKREEKKRRASSKQQAQLNNAKDLTVVEMIEPNLPTVTLESVIQGDLEGTAKINQESTTAAIPPISPRVNAISAKGQSRRRPPPRVEPSPSKELRTDETQTPSGLKSKPQNVGPRKPYEKESSATNKNLFHSLETKPFTPITEVPATKSSRTLQREAPVLMEFAAHRTSSVKNLPEPPDVTDAPRNERKSENASTGATGPNEAKKEKRHRRPSKTTGLHSNGSADDKVEPGHEKHKKGRRRSKIKHRPPMDHPDLADQKKGETQGRAEDSIHKDDELYGLSVGNFFVLEDVLGKGGFGEARRGRHVTSTKKFAIKLERISDGNESLAEEHKIYQILGQHVGFPRSYYFGVGPKEHNALVMDLLGPSLEDYYRAMDKKWSLKTICMVAVQILDRMEYLHSKGYVYSDVKPENFLTGLSEESLDGTIYLIDFGLAQQFKDKDTGKYCYDENLKSHPVGTMRYMSVRSHEARSLSYRDDLESIGYLIVYFIRGRLPWQGMGIKDRQKKVKAVGLKKKTINMEELCQDCPSQLQDYLRYVRSIQFYAEPRYERLRNFFNSVMAANGWVDDGQFDWMGKTYDFAKNKKSDSGLGKLASTANINDDDTGKSPKGNSLDTGGMTDGRTGRVEQGRSRVKLKVKTMTKPSTPVPAQGPAAEKITSTKTFPKPREAASARANEVNPNVDPLVTFSEQEKKERTAQDFGGAREERYKGGVTDRKHGKHDSSSSCYCC